MVRVEPPLARDTRSRLHGVREQGNTVVESEVRTRILYLISVTNSVNVLSFDEITSYTKNHKIWGI